MDKNNLSEVKTGLSVPNIFIFLAILSIICAIAFSAISLTKKYQLSSTEKKLADAQNELKSMKSADDQAMVAAAAVENYDSLNADKNYWSVFLNEIATKTLINSKLNELSLTQEAGVLNIEGTVRSYEDLSKFIVSLRNSDKIESVTLKSANLDSSAGGGVSFALEAIPAGDALAPTSSTEVTD